MSNGFKNLEDKRTKPLRLTNCVLFIVEMVLFAFPYIAMIDSEGNYRFKTILELILGMNAEDNKWIKLGLLAIAFAIIPIVGFFVTAFDKNSCVKSFFGCVCSFAGIFCLVFLIPQFSPQLAFGAMAAIIIYLLIFAISVSLALKTVAIRAMKRKEQEKIAEHNEA